MIGYIYTYTNTVNNKKYVGQTFSEKTRRYQFNSRALYTTNHSNGGKLSHFDRALKKYGKDKFVYEIIQEIECNTKQELIDKLDELEQYYIDYYDSFNNGYNSTTGGRGGLLSEETKQKIGESLKGRPMSELTKEKFTFKGHHISEENKKLLSERMKKKLANKENHPMFGKHHSEESKKKNSESRKGKCTGKDNGKAVAIEQYTLNDEYIQSFDCIADALKHLGKNPKQPGSIIKCCKQEYKTAFGFKWKYGK